MKRLIEKLKWACRFSKVRLQMSTPRLGLMKHLYDITGDTPWPVYCCNDMVTALGHRAALPLAFAVVPSKGNRFIVVTRNFLKLPEWYQRGAMAHEAGHIALGHMGGAISNEIVTLDDIQLEMEADAYAHSRNQASAVMGYLDELQQCLNHPDLDTRIHVLGELACQSC